MPFRRSFQSRSAERARPNFALHRTWPRAAKPQELSFSSCGSTPVSAEPFGAYVLGLGNALVVANEDLVRRGKDPLYCQPPDLQLDLRQYLAMLDAAVTRMSSQDKNSSGVETTLLTALRSMFPCRISEAAPPSEDSLSLENVRLRRADQQFNACAGRLELGANKFNWHDVNSCWSGADILSPLQDLEWVTFRIGTFATDVYFKVSKYETLAFHFRNTDPQKMFRFIAKNAPKVRQTCTVAETKNDVRVDRPVSCTRLGRIVYDAFWAMQVSRPIQRCSRPLGGSINYASNKVDRNSHATELRFTTTEAYGLDRSGGRSAAHGRPAHPRR